ncbi:MAG: carbohydrate kinase [Actinomycetota bacterium]|nr:carbohydrate kinase [Actinomycetota bacterium]
MLVVCGEAVLDLISDGSPTGYQARPGGSPLNVAIGTARLGVPTLLLTRFGIGRFGQLLRAHAAAAGVSLSLSVDADEPAMLAVVGLDESGTASYDFYVDGTAERGWQRHEFPDPLPEKSQALHVGSISSWLPPAAGLLSELVVREYHRGTVLISFDPNLRPDLIRDAGHARACVEQVLLVAQLVKVSVEDLHWLYPRQDPDEAARRWANAGPALVVLTDGANGARAHRPGQPVHPVSARDVSVVDTVGAGDAFAAGLLAALADRGRLHRHGLDDLDDADLDAILGGAALVSALTCARAGADPPNRAERDAALGKSA